MVQTQEHQSRDAAAGLRDGHGKHVTGGNVARTRRVPASGRPRGSDRVLGWTLNTSCPRVDCLQGEVGCSGSPTPFLCMVGCFSPTVATKGSMSLQEETIHRSASKHEISGSLIVDVSEGANVSGATWKGNGGILTRRCGLGKEGVAPGGSWERRRRNFDAWLWTWQGGQCAGQVMGRKPRSLDMSPRTR